MHSASASTTTPPQRQRAEHQHSSHPSRVRAIQALAYLHACSGWKSSAWDDGLARCGAAIWVDGGQEPIILFRVSFVCTWPKSFNQKKYFQFPWAVAPTVHICTRRDVAMPQPRALWAQLAACCLFGSRHCLPPAKPSHRGPTPPPLVSSRGTGLDAPPETRRAIRRAILRPVPRESRFDLI